MTAPTSESGEVKEIVSSLMADQYKAYDAAATSPLTRVGEAMLECLVEGHAVVEAFERHTGEPLTEKVEKIGVSLFIQKGVMLRTKTAHKNLMEKKS